MRLFHRRDRQSRLKVILIPRSAQQAKRSLHCADLRRAADAPAPVIHCQRPNPENAKNRPTPTTSGPSPATTCPSLWARRLSLREAPLSEMNPMRSDGRPVPADGVLANDKLPQVCDTLGFDHDIWLTGRQSRWASRGTDTGAEQ